VSLGEEQDAHIKSDGTARRRIWIRWSHRYGILVLVALFFLMCLPLLPSVSRWRGDERFYTDAAIGMVQQGDYLAPTWSDGTPRFNKPILTYWLILGCYKTMGINYLSSRLPFLVAGALVLWLTYHLSLTLTRRRPESLVAVAVMVSNLTFLHTAIRSTPDMVLTLFLLISLLGFARIILRGQRSVLPYAMAYGGMALAVLTKGFFGLLPLLFAFGYVRLVRPAGIRVRDLVHGPVAVASLVVGLSWFIAALALHGDSFVSGFWGDQLGERFSGGKWYILSNAGVYLSAFFIQMLPWSALALVPVIAAFREQKVDADLRAASGDRDDHEGTNRARRSRSTLGMNSVKFREAFTWRHRRLEVYFMLGWIALLYGVFIFGNIQRTRYFLSTYPMLSIVCAHFLVTGFRNAEVRARLAKVLTGFNGVILLMGLGLLGGGLLIDSRLVLSGSIFTGLAAGLLLFSARWAPAFRLVAAGSLIVVTFAVGDMLVRPVFFVSPAQAMTRELLAIRPAGGAIAIADVSLNYVSQVRVLSGGRLSPIDLSTNATPSNVREFELLVCPRVEFEKGQYGEGNVVRVVQGVDGWRPRDYLRFLLQSRRAKVLALRQKDYCLVIPGSLRSAGVSP